jgi:hypothetical protein
MVHLMVLMNYWCINEEKRKLEVMVKILKKTEFKFHASWKV